MALFLVQKKDDNKGRMYGVYHVHVRMIDGDDHTTKFLIWDGTQWLLVNALGYSPVELDNFGED